MKQARTTTRRTVQAYAALMLDGIEASDREECRVTLSYRNGVITAEPDRALIFFGVDAQGQRAAIRFFPEPTGERWMLEIGVDGNVSGLNLAVALAQEAT